MTQLDPIINAAKSAQYGSTQIQYEAIAAAVIRAAADQLDHATSAHTLYAIADELEAL